MKLLIAFLLTTLFTLPCIAEAANENQILLHIESHEGHYITGVINHAFFWNLGCKEHSGSIGSETINRWLNEGALAHGYNIIQFYQCKDRLCTQVLPLSSYRFTIDTTSDNQIKITPNIHEIVLKDYGQRCLSSR